MKKISRRKFGFTCTNCKKTVSVSERIGTRYRNHCPFCLWSQHVDKKPGDRKSFCYGKMYPIALTSKHEGVDKYGKKREAEVMLLHKCLTCSEISSNRIAADDDVKVVFLVLEKTNPNTETYGTEILTKNDEEKVKKQLLGNENSSSHETRFFEKLDA